MIQVDAETFITNMDITYLVCVKVKAYINLLCNIVYADVLQWKCLKQKKKKATQT